MSIYIRGLISENNEMVKTRNRALCILITFSYSCAMIIFLARVPNTNLYNGKDHHIHTTTKFKFNSKPKLKLFLKGLLWCKLEFCKHSKLLVGTNIYEDNFLLVMVFSLCINVISKFLDFVKLGIKEVFLLLRI